MYVYHNIETDTVITNNEIYARSALIEKLKSQFATYGYREISTSVFEQYNLYAKMNGTVNHREMVKTIDNTGQVIVLRPDITIPLTKELASHSKTLNEDLRYFYVLDVYRQLANTHEYRQHTQAGVEYFGHRSAEADAEIIALAANILNDIEVGNFTIELGHAGFFKQILEDVKLTNNHLKELKRLIQGKNIPDLNLFLKTIDLDDEMFQIIQALPLLYGKLEDVLQKTSQLPLTNRLKEKVADIEAIYKVLEAYGVTEQIVIDLSLINHMDYYSDIIFQGFIEQIGKPILMGGRYDTLSEHFNAQFPAIGFAFDVELLLAGSSLRKTVTVPRLDFTILYDKKDERRAIQLAQNLRTKGRDVVTYLASRKSKLPKAKHTINLHAGNIYYEARTGQKTFHNQQEFFEYFNLTEEDD